MYHNWYELSMVAKQVQKNLYRQADEARLVDAARKTRKEEKRRARQATTVVSAFATFVLQRNEVISIRVPRRSYRISCITGRLWTTINDSPGRARSSLLARRRHTAKAERSWSKHCVSQLFGSSVRALPPLRPAFQSGWVTASGHHIYRKIVTCFELDEHCLFVSPGCP